MVTEQTNHFWILVRRSPTQKRNDFFFRRLERDAGFADSVAIVLPESYLRHCRSINLIFLILRECVELESLYASGVVYPLEALQG